jgi:hypothetical protein
MAAAAVLPPWLSQPQLSQQLPVNLGDLVVLAKVITIHTAEVLTVRFQYGPSNTLVTTQIKLPDLVVPQLQPTQTAGRSQLSILQERQLAKLALSCSTQALEQSSHPSAKLTGQVVELIFTNGKTICTKSGAHWANVILLDGHSGMKQSLRKLLLSRHYAVENLPVIPTFDSNPIFHSWFKNPKSANDFSVLPSSAMQQQRPASPRKMSTPDGLAPPKSTSTSDSSIIEEFSPS